MTSDKSSHSGSTALVAFGLAVFLTTFGGTALAGTGEHVAAVGRADRLANRMSPWRAYVKDDGGAYFRETVMTPAKAPVSFTYGGKEHVGFGACKVLGRMLETKGVETTGRLRVQVDETLVVELEGAYRADFGESEWVLWFENPGTKPSKEISDVVCLRYDFLKCSEEWTCPRLRGIRGDHENLYRPYEIDCWNHPNGYRIDGSEGRPTHVEFPYFDLFTKEGGLLCALGWAGTWRADFDNVRDCPRSDWRFRVSFRACPSFASVLLPGERIRSARVVLIPHKGSDIDHVSNLWRAWFRKYNEPKANAAGEALRPLSTANFAVDTGKPNSDGSISEGHDTWRPTFDKLVAEKIVPDFRWFDAGWYVDPRGKSIPSVWWDVGTWALDAEKWPDGSLRASVDAGHAVGMKTLVWFEPERVCDPPALVTNFGYRAEWALPYGACFWRKEAVVAWNDIGDKDCFAWTRDHILAMMDANGIDLYREDHNFAPGPAWAEGDRRAEAKLKLPRKGMTETKGVMGHWALWDAIIGHGRRTGRCTFVDSCASGGGRNDLESLRRGVPLHRSDSDQATAGLRLSMTSSFCRWIPFHGACTKDVEGDYVVDDGPGASPYVFRASFLPVLNYGTRFVQNRNLDFALLRQNLAEWRSVADLLLKDFYVLTSWHPGDDRSVWTVLAYDDPEKGESVVLAFRQEEASYPAFEAVLKFADPACDYEIVNADTGRRETVSGKDLRTRGYLVSLPERKSSALLRLYRTEGKARPNGFLPEECACPLRRQGCRELTVDAYRDRMEAGWLGQMIGVAWGAPVEFKFNGRLVPTDKIPFWVDGMINGTFEQDDLYVEMTFLRSMEQYGIDVTIRQAGIDFANSTYLLWHANAAGPRRPLRRPHREDVRRRDVRPSRRGADAVRVRHVRPSRSGRGRTLHAGGDGSHPLPALRRHGTPDGPQVRSEEQMIPGGEALPAKPLILRFEVLTRNQKPETRNKKRETRNERT